MCILSIGKLFRFVCPGILFCYLQRFWRQLSARGLFITHEFKMYTFRNVQWSTLFQISEKYLIYRKDFVMILPTDAFN